MGFCAVVDDNEGPLHVYTVAPPDGLAESVAVPPEQSGPLLVGDAVGFGFMVALVVYDMEHPAPVPLLTVTV